MIEHRHHHKISKALAVFFFALLLVIGISYLVKNFSLEETTSLVRSQGTTGQIIYFSYLIISTIIAPLTSLPLWPIAFFAYGFWPAVILTFGGNLIGAMANFYIARVFGREIIHLIAGSRILKQIDAFAEDMGWKGFFVLRVLGNISFDIVSYAVGLTEIPARTYFLITFVTQFFWVAGAFFLIDKAVTIGGTASILMTAVVYILSVYGGIELWRRHHHHGPLSRIKKPS